MSQDNVSEPTLDLLESRLRRIGFALTGEGDATDLSQDARPAAARLRTLERQLDNLTAKSQTAAQVLALHHEHPSVFHADTSSRHQLAPASLASVVLAHAQSYQRLSQQSSALSNLSVPDPTSLVPLVNLQARIDKVAVKHSEMTQQAAALRTRSAQLLELWYQSGVLGMSERWTHWEECLRDVEILVRRMEAARKREIDAV
ncbi:hypothetical protein AMS68_001083 [Peltaster fructicola]|uniref:Nuclear distribution protein RO10 n=1 Tax=Peltaster fructicola TaxID=286661 RepID=A0A6H0XLI5_9PEZI|nr:hypothetical protein AMS68_001083 [Peltaster fructicola]